MARFCSCSSSADQSLLAKVAIPEFILRPQRTTSPLFACERANCHPPANVKNTGPQNWVQRFLKNYILDHRDVKKTSKSFQGGSELKGETFLSSSKSCYFVELF